MENYLFRKTSFSLLSNFSMQISRDQHRSANPCPSPHQSLLPLSSPRHEEHRSFQHRGSQHLFPHDAHQDLVDGILLPTRNSRDLVPAQKMRTQDAAPRGAGCWRAFGRCHESLDSSSESRRDFDRRQGSLAGITALRAGATTCMS